MPNKELKYTKPPWTHTKLDKWNYITRNNSTSLPDIIATIEQNGDDEEANAQFIVKAVNNHEALVGALEGLYKYEMDNLTSKYSYEEAMAKAKQALSLAKGEK